ncbi:MAG: hypothetical protein ISR72_06850 [Methylobacter sp.]|nr:hypothetical protein [Methylobacter sp.]
MFNFTKKHDNALIDINEQAVGVNERYNAAIKRIEWLEYELNQKTQALNQSCKAQSIMTEGVKICTASLYTLQAQLQTVASHLDRSNKQILELMQKNKALRSSGDTWFRRAIKLEFAALMTKDEIKKIENERDTAIKMCEHLQVELVLGTRKED